MRRAGRRCRTRGRCCCSRPSGRRTWTGSCRRHNPPKMLLDLAVALPLGGDRLADVALLRAGPQLFGPVASNPTVSRTASTKSAPALFAPCHAQLQPPVDQPAQTNYVRSITSAEGNTLLRLRPLLRFLAEPQSRPSSPRCATSLWTAPTTTATPNRPACSAATSPGGTGTPQPTRSSARSSPRPRPSRGQRLPNAALARLWSVGAGPTHLAGALTIDLEETIVVWTSGQAGLRLRLHQGPRLPSAAGDVRETGQVLMSRLWGGAAGAALERRVC
jgi:hypothetical protein